MFLSKKWIKKKNSLVSTVKWHDNNNDDYVMDIDDSHEVSIGDYDINEW